MVWRFRRMRFLTSTNPLLIVIFNDCKCKILIQHVVCTLSASYDFSIDYWTTKLTVSWLLLSCSQETIYVHSGQWTSNSSEERIIYVYNICMFSAYLCIYILVSLLYLSWTSLWSATVLVANSWFFTCFGFIHNEIMLVNFLKKIWAWGLKVFQLLLSCTEDLIYIQTGQ